MSKKRGYQKRSRKQREEARWAAKSGPVTIIRPARDRPELNWKPDGLDLARAQYARYKVGDPEPEGEARRWRVSPTSPPPS